MKHLTQLLAGSLVALAFVVLGSQAYAFESAADIQARLAELREVHADLKAQVEAGEITPEEARAQWQALLAEARAEKDAYFAEKMEKVQDRYEMIAERNPEAAELLKERIDLAMQRRDEHLEKRAELRAQVASGEITRDEARQAKLQFYQDQRMIYQEARQDIRERARELRGGEEFNRDDIIRPIDPLRPTEGRQFPSTSIIDVTGALGAQGKVDAANLGSVIRPTLPPQGVRPNNVRPAANAGAVN